MDQSTHELNRDIQGTREDLAQDLNDLHQKISPTAVMDRKKEAVKDSIHSARERLMGSVDAATSTVTDGVGSATSSVTATAGQAKDKVQGNPLAVGAIGFGIGMMLSSLLPASHREAQAASLITDAVEEPLRQHAQEMRDHMKTAASDATQAVKEQASDSASSITDEARSGVEDLKDTTSNGTDTTRQFSQI